MVRGLETLFFKGHLMNPLRHGVFAWMLISHKLLRWVVFLVLPCVALGLALLLPARVPTLLLGLVALAGTLTLVGLSWPVERKLPAPIAVPSFIVVSIAAALVAWSRALSGRRESIWEPTRRPVVAAPAEHPTSPEHEPAGSTS
jgi:hypothetical protein